MVAHWVLGPLGTGRHRLCAAGAPGLALWVPHPLCALKLSRNSSGVLLAHWESDLPADPPVGSLGLLDGHCSCCAKWRCRGTLGRAGGTMGGVGGPWVPLGGLLVLVWGVGWGALVVPFPLTAGLPLVGSPSCCENNPSGLRETPPTQCRLSRGCPGTR